MKSHNTYAQKWLWVMLLTIGLVSGCVTPEPENLVRQQTQPPVTLAVASLPEATVTLEGISFTPSPFPPLPSPTPRITPTAPTPITETRAYNSQLPLRAENITVNTVNSFIVGTDITFKSWSPDGEKFLFGRVNQRHILVQFQNGAAANGFWDDLWIASVDGTYQHQLAELVNDWAWSPDGQQVACLSPAGEQGITGHLYVVNLKNLQSTKIADCDVGGMDDVFWLPTGEITCRKDGVMYAISTNGSRTQALNSIFSTDFITDALTKELLPPVFQGHYRIAPNGQRVAYVRRSQPSLWIANIDGNNLTEVRIEDSPYISHDFVWSPDSTQLAFSVPNNTKGLGIDLWVVNADGTGAYMVATSEQGDTQFTEPTWSPDGKVIAFTYRVYRDTEYESVWLTNGDGTNPHLLVDVAFAPQWSINGNNIAILRERVISGPESQLVIVNLNQ